jgi:hypothetical protein
VAAQLQRPPRENVTPLVLEKVAWAGAKLGSYQQAAEAMQELAGVDLVAKQTHRITSQIGADAVDERQKLVNEHQKRPLMERVTAPPKVKPASLAVVMMDGGRYQRRDHFRARREAAAADRTEQNTTPEQSRQQASNSNAATASTSAKTHWREDKIGIVLSMTSEVHDHDPSPEFPEWLARADVVAQLAHLTGRDEQEEDLKVTNKPECTVAPEVVQDWPDIAPKLVSREVIASCADAEAFGHHLEWKAWTLGVPAAPRQAFVADGQAVNWNTHKKHFSQMTGVLDLMHALSYAWRAAESIDDRGAYRRYATWIWQGNVQCVIDELQRLQHQLGIPPPGATASDPRERVDRAMTYYRNHSELMKYPEYRKQGLPLTSSHMESTVKMINARVKGSEKFWRKEHGESLLHLRAESLSDSKPLAAFWVNWRNGLTGVNH